MDRFEGKYLLLSKTEACLESTLRSSAQAKIATSTLLLALSGKNTSCSMSGGNNKKRNDIKMQRIVSGYFHGKSISI